MISKMTNEKTEPRVLSDVELDYVHGGAPPHQGSGKTEGGNKVDVFAGNPHDRPGANAK
jgi:hypothetical protein